MKGHPLCTTVWEDCTPPQLPQAPMISLPAWFSVCDVGLMSVPCPLPASVFMHVLEDSELKHNFPGQQLSQPSPG